jgi:ABC-type sugar transport system ATPase subunit
MNLIPARLISGEDDRLVLDAAGLRLQVPMAYGDCYRDYLGRSVILGIRPEDIHDSQNRSEWQPIDAAVVAIEALGAEVVLIAALGGPAGIELSARLDRDYRAAVGSAQRLYLDLMEMQLFDPETTNAVPRRT